MPKIVAYAVSDEHLPEKPNAGAWVSLPEVKGDSLHALGRAVDLCLESAVPLLSAGDHFDGPDPDPLALAAVYQQLRRLEHDDLNVYHVLGNHDGGRDWYGPLGPVAVNVSGRVVLLPCGMTVTGLSCVPSQQAFVDRTAALHRTDLGLYHQRWAELSGASPYSVSQLPDHGLAVCGDVHVRAVLDRATYGRMILSPGPLSPQSVAEFSGKGAAVYAVYEDFTVREVPIPGRKFLRFDVSSPRDAERVMTSLAGLSPDDDLHPELRRPMVAVRLDCHVPGFAEAAERLARDRGVVLRAYETVRRPSAVQHATPGASVSPAGLQEVILGWPDDKVPPESRLLAAKAVEDNADLDGLVESVLKREAHRAAAAPGRRDV